MKKIFGIGLSRTATTSLSRVLNDMGFKIVHYPNQKQIFGTDNQGTADIPTAAHFKELDKKFPNSKFIYTVRDKEEWLNSMEKYMERKKGRKYTKWQLDNRIVVFGQLEYDRDVFSQKYDEHDRKIKEYFKDREDDLLILDICGGDDINKLKDFLNVKEDIDSFPHENKLKEK